VPPRWRREQPSLPIPIFRRTTSPHDGWRRRPGRTPQAGCPRILRCHLRLRPRPRIPTLGHRGHPSLSPLTQCRRPIQVIVIFIDGVSPRNKVIFRIHGKLFSLRIPAATAGLVG